MGLAYRLKPETFQRKIKIVLDQTLILCNVDLNTRGKHQSAVLVLFDTKVNVLKCQKYFAHGRIKERCHVALIEKRSCFAKIWYGMRANLGNALKARLLISSLLQLVAIDAHVLHSYSKNAMCRKKRNLVDHARTNSNAALVMRKLFLNASMMLFVNEKTCVAINYLTRKKWVIL